MAGRTDAADFPTTPGALVGAVDAGSYTGFLAKLNADASLAWATMLGPSYTYASSILVDSGGNVILAGNGAVPHQPLFLHDAKEGLHGIEVDLAVGREPLVDVAHAPLAQVPEDLEDF